MISKFGKKPARRDARTLRLGAILNTATMPPLPERYDFDDAHPGVPNSLYGNDSHPNCVIAGRAHQTLRFELSEQGTLPDISEEDVMAEWRRQCGAVEEGLVLLDSLKLWQSRGWRAGGRSYTIKAFAQVDPTDRQRMKTAIYLLDGIGLGLLLPRAVTQDPESPEPWTVPEEPALAEKDPRGGHYVLLTGYDETGPVGVTWGRKQSMTWEFVARYADEAYAILDGVNRWAGAGSPINTKALGDYLQVVGTMM